MKNVTLHLILIFILGVLLNQLNAQSTNYNSSSFRMSFHSNVLFTPDVPHCYPYPNHDHGYAHSYETYSDNPEAHTVCSQYTMTYAAFEYVKARLRQQQSEFSLMLSMKQEVYGKKITVYQVHELLGMLGTDRNRLEMAKYLFDYTCNRSRYYTLNELLLAPCVQELNQYLRGRDMSDDPSDMVYDSGNYNDHSEYGTHGNGNNGSTVIVPPTSSGNDDEGSPVVIVPADPNYTDNDNGGYDNSYEGYGNQNGRYNGNYGNDSYGNGGYDHHDVGYGNGSYNNGHHHHDNYTTDYCCDALCEADFADVKHAISHATFSDSKRQVMEQALDERCVNTNQVRELLGMLTFDSDKVEAAKFLYPRTVDKRNYYKVNSAFTFSSSVDELDQYIKTCSR